MYKRFDGQEGQKKRRKGKKKKRKRKKGSVWEEGEVKGVKTGGRREE